MALWLTGAFFALTVVGIDVGHLGTSATELQTVADIAAAAGARNLLKGGSASTAKSDATSVVAKNKVDGQSFTMSAVDVHVGTYIGGAFTETSINPSAVRATPSVTVNNVVAGLVGMKTSTIQKEAIASFQGVSKAAPTLPIVLGDCFFPEIDQCFGTDSCLPKDTKFPKDSEPRTAWTSFTGGQASGKTIPSYSVGDTITIVGGIHNSDTHKLDCLYNSGRRQFVVPVVQCNSSGTNLTGTVSGFATLVIDNADNNKGVDFHVISQEIDAPLAGGCAKCGSGKMMLVR
ncbi:MAG: hypothetical protein E6J70_16810 [Deltaproteobacteria bacterium]|nr:MAG: hypothetical protein E6J70_16810 [Deltaproteobacteria bacterium]